eukprot:TRINITY_DN2952_c0_g1_i1.p1 TRINITY_DN2952_c0_g1~~TRINITY_DN2952_c0_g1_i1.p1  ORF type:complete len:160 (+),score=28.59 TRINITY_DN2952_c0_g1_i1:103-582(+)
MSAMGRLTILKGDATKPVGKGKKIIAHIANDIGGWGKGFVVAISARWKLPEREYRTWSKRSKDTFKLGEVQFVCVEEDVTVANMIGQRGKMKRGGLPPIRYDAVDKCLTAVAKHARHTKSSVHMPRIGCGLAGGKWSEIEKLIHVRLIAEGVNVYVYDF